MSTEHIRTIEMERYFTGGLGGADAERVRLHVGGCAECGARLAELEAERIRFLNVRPFEEFARNSGLDRNNRNKINIFNNIRGAAKKRFAGWTGAPARYGAVFAAVAALILIPLAMTDYWHKQSIDGGLPAAGGIRYKGVQGLSFMLMRDGEVRQGSPSEVYRAGDRLQIAYSYPKSHHAALFSVDNSGAVSFYAGKGGPVCSVPADSGSGLVFPSSIVLDDTKGEELVVMLISESPVSAENVGSVVKRLAKGDYADLSGIENGLKHNVLGAALSVRIRKE